jgi:hypothetical protein
MTGAPGWLEQFTEQAWRDFQRDPGYAVEIARAAAGLAQRAGRSPAAFDRADHDSARAAEPVPALAPASVAA